MEAAAANKGHSSEDAARSAVAPSSACVSTPHWKNEGTGVALRPAFQLQFCHTSLSGHGLSQSLSGHLLGGCQRLVHASGYTRIIWGVFSKYRSPSGPILGQSKVINSGNMLLKSILKGSQVNKGHQGEDLVHLPSAILSFLQPNRHLVSP